MTYVPTYATQADCEAYTEGLEVADAAAFLRLLERAERDVDLLFAPLLPLDSGLRLDPAELDTWEAAALNRAVCAQVEWRLIAGERQLGGDVPATVKRVKGPDFEKEYAVSATTTPARLGPKVGAELAAISHLRLRVGRAVP